MQKEQLSVGKLQEVTCASKCMPILPGCMLVQIVYFAPNFARYATCRPGTPVLFPAKKHKGPLLLLLDMLTRSLHAQYLIGRVLLTQTFCKYS